MIVDLEAWRAREAAHQHRVDVWVQPHLERRHRGEKHPVHDFLFTYYSHRPSALRRWHPGYGVDLVGGSNPATVTLLAQRRPLIERIRRLLVATASRSPTLGCFGLHEWAMVHRTDATRHDWPLRLGPAGTDTVVESHRIACSHFDAFRFFTPSARPLNTLHPSRDDREALEQPGCLHAGMDLYKHAFRLSPLIASELVADAFELAWDIRIMDMRAAPYDLSGLVLDPSGEEWTPVKIETPEGKREYADRQRHYSERGGPIRQRLIDECERLLSATEA
ncbi:3-methyladenine DNA glycosylase [Nocardioides terrisoli]|uniref:3-methyladenine DNA glycosylase n=1 Tax=Nocardioides terrisoli TaxID=3388267 RepID=UPI00287B7A46|nr:3-methyladenine DNA glycosylase [Nocardioides marmorisolisilvae]